MTQNFTNYDSYKIEVCSYKLVTSGMWQPKVILREDKKKEIISTPLLWDRVFPTKEEADKFALAQTKMFIERKFS